MICSKNQLPLKSRLLINFHALAWAITSLKKAARCRPYFMAPIPAAVKAFMDKKIKFTDIPVIIQNTMDAHEIIKDPDIDAILDSEKWAEEYAKALIGKND